MSTTQTATLLPRRHIPVIQEAVGVFHDPEKLQEALDDLEQHGFMRQELSIHMGDPSKEKEIEEKYHLVERAEDDPEAERTIFIPNEVIGEAEGSVIGLPLYLAAFIGATAAAAAGMPIGATAAITVIAGAAGGLTGLLGARYIAKRHASSIREQLERGGIILWVALRSPKRERRALKILRRHDARHIHLHEIPV